MEYYVVMRDFGRRGLEAVVHPERTRNNVIDLIRSREWDQIKFVHHIHDGTAEDVTEEILRDASLEAAE